MKEQIIEMYKEAAMDVYKAMPKPDEEYTADQREVFAEKYGRRQAIGRILKEVCGMTSAELQDILDTLHKHEPNRLP